MPFTNKKYILKELYSEQNIKFFHQLLKNESQAGVANTQNKLLKQ